MRAGRLALSNRPKIKQLSQFAALGCERVVTVQGKNEMPGQIDVATRAAGMAWTWIPVGHGKFPEGEADRYLRRGLLDVVSALDGGESVLIHCSAGIHRTGMLAFAVLRWSGATEEEALETLSALRTATREGVREEHLRWGNQLAAEAGRG